MRINRLKIMMAGIVVIALTIIIWWAASGTTMHVSKDKGTMAITPMQIEHIRSIGQWEFLSISDEELIDTIRHGFFGDDELTRVYYGTLRLGIDLADTQDGWIHMDNDTVAVTLPHVKLLDDNFLDEARTRSFIEDGKWTEADRAALTQRAVVAMRRRCLTPANIKKAEDNAKTQMAQTIRAMGYKNVRVEFEH